MSKYLLIDDEVGGGVPAELYANAIAGASGGKITFELFKPGDLSACLAHISNAKVDGVLIDVAFTNATDQARRPLAYDGVSLAQQIRTLQTRRLHGGTSNLKDMPLIRFSKRDIVKEYISGDTTSDDLFDEKVDKDDVNSNSSYVAQKLDSIAEDYPRIIEFAGAYASDEALSSLLSCEPALLERIDSRALVGMRRINTPAHVLSRQLLSVLLGRPGPLIDEPLVALRLGIDTKSSPDWEALLAKLSEAQYVGAFSRGYGRWWMTLILDWWSNNVESSKTLARLPSPERVELLREKTGLIKLQALAADEESPGLRYWYFCQKSKRPVDPSNGFPLLPLWGQEVWQDTEYLCEEEALQDIRNPRLSPSDRQRIAVLRERRAK